MTRRPSIFLLAVTLMLGLTAPVFAQKPVKIGVLTPLSPPGDTGAGQLILRGAKMAAEELNGRGGIAGRKVELVVEDDGGTLHARRRRQAAPVPHGRYVRHRQAG